MKILITLLSLFFFTNNFAQNYKQVKIFLQEKKDIQYLYEIGLEFDHTEYTKDNAIIIFISDAEFSILKTSGFRYDVLIDDWFEYYNQRSQLTENEKRAYVEQSKRDFNVTGFDYGTMGGYYTLAEMIAELDTMRMLYPNLITAKQSIGNTIENRPTYMVKISDNPDITENEPRVSYTAIHHAREPESLMQMIYFMYYLLENYDTDPSVQYLVNNRELFFIPCVNPDGYEYNRQTNPDGGGFWRKNRRNNGSGIYGVDLNRNYGPMNYWNAPNGGSSTSPSSDTYRGTAPFSEPETNNIKNFLAGKGIKNTLNYHTYGNYLIYPYGALEMETPDSLIFREFASDMTSYNNYTQGTDQQTVGYSTRGNSDDYHYDGDIPLNGSKIFAMTPEVGNSSDGFWPLQSRIFPLAQENVLPNLYFAWIAGDYVSLVNANFQQQYFLPEDVVELIPEVKNKGLSTAYNISVELSSLSAYASVNTNSVLIDSLQSRQSVSTDPFSFTISSDASVEERIKLLVTIWTNGIKVSDDTISIVIGLLEFVFTDTTNNILDLWNVTSTPANPHWEATTLSYYSTPNSYTDSKNGDYSSDATVTMTLANSIDLSSFQNPVLKFWTKYDIESGWDYGQVKISTNNGSIWIPLEGEYTQPGSGNFQPEDQPVYDGIQPNWVIEEISLEGYTTSQVKIRFELKSDGFIERDGWYVDDIGIAVYNIVPVELTSFTANVSEQKIILNWATATELNNYGFEIERASGNKDGLHYITIGFVNGKGSSTEISNYTFIDKSPFAGKSFYRLKQIDFDGTYKYYNSVSVEYSGVTEYELSQNYPNPFNPKTVINYSIPKSGNVSLKIYNVLGVEVAELVNGYKEVGKHSVDFSTEILKDQIGSGVYFYSLKAGEFVQTRKMIVIK